MQQSKSRTMYIVLAVLLGCFGVHDFYVGKSGTGVVQLMLTLLSCGLLSPLTWLWAIIEAVSVTADSRGVPLSE